MKKLLKKYIKEKGENGQALILVLVLLLVGGLIITPLLSLMSTGIFAGEVHEELMEDLYAADAGVEDALWKIREEDPANDWGWQYDIFDMDYYTQTYEYILSTINGRDVNVKIEPFWILAGLGDECLGSHIPDGAMPHQDWIVVGDLIGIQNGNGLYQISLSYNGTGNKKVDIIGVWLPQGYEYVDDSCNLGSPTPMNPQAYDRRGGTAYVWDFGSSGIDFDNLPPVTEDDKKITFEFTPATRPEAAFCWVRLHSSDICIAWDADVKTYGIESTAGNTTIQAITAKNELRQLDAAISGDYRAIGNALMIDQYPDMGGPVRETLLTESDATIDDIPDDAYVVAAYLYWSGWYDDSTQTTIWSDDCSQFGSWQTVWQDSCTKFADWQTVWSDGCTKFADWQTVWSDDCNNNFDNWDDGNDWSWNFFSGWFEGHHNFFSSDDERYLTLSDSIDLSSYSGQTVEITWEQYEGGRLEDDDRLYFAISSDGGSSWSADIEAFRDDDPSNSYSYTVPDAYLTANFKLRYYLYGFNDGGGGGPEYCYIDNIAISASSGDLWYAGADWDVWGGEFRGHHYGGSDDERYLTMSNGIDLSSYSGHTVKITWSQDEGGNLESDDRLYFAISNDGGSSWSADIEAFRDDDPSSSYSYTVPDAYLTANFKLRYYLYGFNDGGPEYCYIDNIAISASSGDLWYAGADWDVYGGEFRGHHYGGSDDERYLTMSNGIDLSSYSGQTVEITWTQHEIGNLASDDRLYFAVSSDGGSSWSADIEAFHDDNPSSPYSYIIPDSYLTAQFKIRFYLDNFDGSGDYAYIDDIEINATSGGWINGADWDVWGGEFRGHHYGGSDNDRYLTLSDSIDLSSYSGQTVEITWDQYADYYYTDSTDALYFQLSSDGNFPDNYPNGQWIEAFHGPTSSSYSYTIPDSYLTDNFKIRFYLYSFNDYSEYAYIDDIEIRATQLPADETAILKINGNQVYFDSYGDPQVGAQELTADTVQVIVNTSSYLPGTYFYSSKKDVTELVQAYSNLGVIDENNDGTMDNHTGNAAYTCGDVDATWNANSEIAYAGWSLIVIYTSLNTQGHQLYLFDDFFTSDQNNSVDFDQDGNPGGTISGFLVPEPVLGEVNAAHITVFVGEGDDYYDGDYVAFNAPSIPASSQYKLWDGTTSSGNSAGSPNDVWNDKSVGMSADGVDVDNFYVTWASGLLTPGDTSAQIDLWTSTDIWEIVYIVLSFRSDISTAGAMSYIIE